MLKKLLPILGLLVTVSLSAQRFGPEPGTLVEYPDAHDPVAAFCDGRYYVFTTGMGHCAVVNFDGKDYMFMHGYDSEYEYRSKLLVCDITWTPDGWPMAKLE